nr:hypothetical protein [Tanacetum cinerariifolium]
MATKPLDADLSGTPDDQTKYRSMVGALMYLTASTRYCTCNMLLYSLSSATNSKPIFDVEPLQTIPNDDDNYNVFANDREHPEQPESVNDTYPDEQGDTSITTDSLDMSNNGGDADQDEDEADQDEDEDLARERDLLAS